MGSPVCDAVCWRERLPTLSVVRLQIPVLVAGRVRLYTKRQTLLSVCLGGTPAVDVRGTMIGVVGAAAGIYIQVGIEVRFVSLIVGRFCSSHHVIHCCNDYGHYVECNTQYR